MHGDKYPPVHLQVHSLLHINAVSISMENHTSLESFPPTLAMDDNINVTVERNNTSVESVLMTFTKLATTVATDIATRTSASVSDVADVASIPMPPLSRLEINVRQFLSGSGGQAFLLVLLVIALVCIVSEF